MTTLLCVPITVTDATQALAAAARAAELGADLVELRIDEFFSGSGEAGEIEQIVRMVADSPVPTIVTCRPVWEGGAYDGDEDARVSLFERLGAADRPPRYIDVELAAYARSANFRSKVHLAVDHPGQRRDLATGLILSLHDFAGRPADLTRRLLAMQAEAAAKVLKIAFRARTVRDNLELFDILGQRDRPTIALGMGECGLLSRVLAPKFGAFLTFASLSEQQRSAPGQPTVVELLERYRFRSIGPATRVYGVVGWPVGHSLSPDIHNAGFAAVGHDGVLLPLPVAESYESFKATVLELAEHPRLDLAGLAVTLPHKQHMVRLAREVGWSIDAAAAAIGAANTLAIRRDAGGRPQPLVTNTDAGAISALLKQELGPLPGRTVAIIGAGGVARAAAWALAEAGAEVILYNRTPERAAALADDLGKPAVSGRPLDAMYTRPHDAYINATSVGMAGGPAPEASPVDIQRLQPAPSLLLETIYAPAVTPLLGACAAAGWGAIGGARMFVAQGEAQFRLWTGAAPPAGLFASVVADRQAGGVT
ncbi:MAG: type I 3-dehydroquinate dehydratase [Phycisphaerales bacterium JB039]